MKINFNLMNKLGTAALLMGSLACVPLKSDLEDSTLKSSAKSIEFKDFCRQAALENCDINYLTHIKDSSWDAGIDTFSEVMRSESFLHFSRSTFSQNSVKSLVNTLGGQGVIAFVDRIPWDSISMSQMDESITLKNEKYNTQASFNGLTFIAKKVAQITPAGNRRFNVSGINLLTNLGLEQIYQIDLNDPAVMHFETDQGWINNIPVNYFYLEDQMMAKRKEFTPGDLVEAISDVILDDTVVGVNDIYVSFERENVKNISDPIMSNIKPGLGKDIANLILDKSNGLNVNFGRGKNLASVYSNDNTRCTFKLMGHDSAVAFKKIVSLGAPTRNGAGVDVPVRGIDVTVKLGIFPINGSVEKVYVGPDKVALTVMGKTFDLEYDKPQDGNQKPAEGPKGLTCK